MDKSQLIKFEKEIGDMFNNKLIKSPIHLYSGNEDFIIEIFNEIDKENDWVCCTWRNHYQALLKGIPEDLVRQKILDGKSMVLNFFEHKFISSSIVGGIPSIAAGIAYANKLSNNNSRVWCWVGDMSAETGAFHEAYKFSLYNELPITFVIEDNKKSVCTPTSEAWKRDQPYYLEEEYKGQIIRQKNLYYYQYTNDKYPHAGAGKRIQF
jgi:TPP-dependent pyruvate/acetoin dehydrogenase alpha subunit